MDQQESVDATRLWQELTGCSDEETSRMLEEWRETHLAADKPDEEEEALKWVLENALTPIWRNRDQQELTPKSTIIVKGSVTFKPEEGVPEFTPFADGLEEEIVCVFANDEDDDRSVTVRSCTLRFHSGEFPKESKFDLKMETGSGLWKDFESFKAFKEAFDPTSEPRDKKERVKAFMLKSPKNYQNVCRAFVKDPPTVLGLTYNSSFPLSLEGDDGNAYFAKFRVIPHSDETWCGLTEEDQREFWDKLAPPEEDTRESNYLKQQLNTSRAREAFKGDGSVRIKRSILGQMKLQVMLAKQGEEEGASFFLPDTEWGPWLDLGMVTLTQNPLQTEAMLPDYLDHMRINSGNLPSGLSIIPPTSIKDPRWCLATRVKIEESCSNLKEVLGSTCTIEAQANYRGQDWRNEGRTLYQEMTGHTDAEVAVQIVSDFSSWSRVPWTSEEKESDMTMLVKSRIIAAKTLQTEWDTEVISYHFQCSISVVQAPPCHQHGVAVSGQASMDPDDKVPKIPFFQTETSVSVKARFSNLGSFGKDDRASTPRGCLVTLATPGETMHLHMNTGVAATYENLMTFDMANMANTALQNGDIDTYKKWLATRPANYYAVVDSTVAAPSSYANLQYNSKFPLILKDSSGEEHYCRFRLVPEAIAPFQGLLNEAQQREVWNPRANQDDQRKRRYLRKEMHKRLKEGTETRFLLQIMTKKKTGLEPPIFFHPIADWQTPWRKVAEIDALHSLDEKDVWGPLLGHHPCTEATEDLPPQIEILPDAFQIIQPTNSFDPNWINYCRHEVYHRNLHCRRLRAYIEAPKQKFKGKCVNLGPSPVPSPVQSPTQSPVPSRKLNATIKNVAKYKVTAYTGDVWYAGTDSVIRLSIVGTSGATRLHNLNTKWENDFEAGATKTYSFLDYDVGPLEFIIVQMERPKMEKLWSALVPGNSDWYLEKVIVEKGVDRRIFPHFQWVNYSSDPKMEAPLMIQCTWTRLPQDDTYNGITSRLLQGQQKKAVNLWSYDLPVGSRTEDMSKHLPGFLLVPELTYDSLQNKYKWFEERYKEYLNLRKTLKNIGLGSIIRSWFDPIDCLEEYREVTNEFTDVETEEDKWLEDWDKEEEFGRQTLNGMNPVMIERIREIPENFPVIDYQVAGLLKRNLTLKEEAAEGYIYLVDFKVLEGIPTGWDGMKKDVGKKLDMAAAMALFYHEPENDQLVPLAIQLGQTPGPNCPIWTKNDTAEDWLLAKFWFRHADAQVSQISTHLAYTHFFVEPFAVAMHRCLLPVHPIHKMLKEHLKFIISVDTLGREILTAPGGSADVSLSVGHGSDGLKMLLAKVYKSMTWEDFDYPADLKRRDMMDLPGYHHRDDCIVLWDAILEYVQGMVDAFYKDDLAVVGDWELQDWVKDVFENGFGKMEGIKAPSLGLPSEILTKEELVKYLQKLVYTDTVRHTFANFYTFQYGRFAPNSPTVMNGSLPTERGKATMETVMACLPTRKQAIIAAATAKVLGSFSADEVYLSDTPSWMFGEDEPRNVFERLRNNLQQIEEDIVARNSKLRVPYTILQPSRIPAGIAI